ncbi:MAG: uroporphyrinogen-III synthase [Alphaproteobacteria bacterium]|nr:uroporphyrinogen-III synthase [Alphaproteobacteria bacterium]
MTGVIVTRPEPWILETSIWLREAGYDPLMAPVTVFQEVHVPRPAFVAENASVILTSRTALIYLADRRDEVKDLFPLTCFCVGPSTAQEARAFGFRHVLSTKKDGADLAALILEKSSGPLLHIGGEASSQEPDQSLIHARRDLFLWPVYKTEPVHKIPFVLQKALQAAAARAVLSYSVESAKSLVHLVHQNGLSSCCAGLIAVGLSQAVSDTLQDLPFERIVTSKQPQDIYMREALETYVALKTGGA